MTADVGVTAPGNGLGHAGAELVHQARFSGFLSGRDLTLQPRRSPVGPGQWRTMDSIPPGCRLQTETALLDGRSGHAVADPRLGEDEARIARVVSELAAQVLHDGPDESAVAGIP